MANVAVPPVWPVGSQVSIAGVSITGQAITGGVLGNQIGVPLVKGIFRQPTGGVQTAQAFGLLSFYQIYAVHPVGLGSAQTFGAIITRLGGYTQAVGGIASVAAFGVVQLNQRRTVGAVASAQQFSLSLQINQIVHPAGFYPYGPYIPSITGQVISGDGHLVGGKDGTGSQFGRPSFYLIYRLTGIGGIPSAQSFGTIKIVQIVHPLGVPSAQAFGTKIGIKFRVLGLDSEAVVGTPRVFLVWMRVAVCTDLDLAVSTPITIDLVPAVCT